uniref:Heparanase-like protein 2 n=1 Tax=Kalanchoe fedtschenkoi TaxID=63787 RepID=A0A7N1A6R8_KALFE
MSTAAAAMSGRRSGTAMWLSIIITTFMLSSFTSHASSALNVELSVRVSTPIATTDDNVVCATLDWWPADKCDYGQCPWGRAGILNLDLQNVILKNAIKAFNPLRIRIGGSLQDQVLYDVGNVKKCPHLKKQEGGLFGFSKGCLHMERWDQINDLMNQTGAKLTFGLNALIGKKRPADNSSILWEVYWPKRVESLMASPLLTSTENRYLDQLGMTSTFDHKVYCRQALIGGNYGLLNTTSFVPNPDYYGALLWYRLMGTTVLEAYQSTTPYLRAYAHCSKDKAGVTLLLINLSNSTANYVSVAGDMNFGRHLSEASEGSKREEYRLTPQGGNIQSDILLLNGKPLKLTESFDIPSMEPELVDSSTPIVLDPHSIVYAKLPYFQAPACANKNAHDFMEYTVSKGYKIDSWELGNELCGEGVSARLEAKQYAKDITELKNLVKKFYPDEETQPPVLGPAGFYNQTWFDTFLEAAGPDVVNGVTHHIYNLGAGVDPNLIHKIQDPYYLSQVAQTFKNAMDSVKSFAPWAGAWVGESGGAYNSGGRDVSHTFANSFWYLDQLGMKSTFDHKVYCRQALIGGNYGLLNTTSFVPNPDYYGALLWHRLMGKTVLETYQSTTPYLRAYAHCSKDKAGVTLLLINLSNSTANYVSVAGDMNFGRHLSEASEGSKREEYRLTPQGGNIQSDILLLNGKPLKLSESFDIPSMEPELIDSSTPIVLDPHSIVYAKLPYFQAPASDSIFEDLK